MLAHAIDNPAPSTIVLISGDRGFAYALSILRLRRYCIILITLSNAHPSLRAQASLCFNWISDVSGTVDPTSVLHQHTSPRRGKTSIPPTHNRILSDTKGYNLSRSPFQEPYDEKPASSSVEFVNHLQDKAKYRDIFLTPPKCDFRPASLPPELEPSKRQPADSMALTNLRNGPESLARIIYSPFASSSHAYLNDSIEASLIMTGGTSNDSNSSQTLPSSGENTPKLAPQGNIVASRHISLRGSTSLPNLVLEHEATYATEPVSFESAMQTEILPAEPDLRRFFPSPQQQSACSTKSYSLSTVNRIFDPIGNPEFSPAHLNTYLPTNVTTPLPTSAPSFRPPLVNDTTLPTTAQSSVKTTNPVQYTTPPSVPDKFKILVQCLKSHRSKGILRPLRTHIAEEIACNGTTYRQAGVTKFREYAAMAEKEGIIALGSCQGTAWITLLESWV